MQANVTFSQLYTNPSVMKFFFRQQSIDTLEDLLSRSAMDDDGTLKRLEAAQHGVMNLTPLKRISIS